MSEAVSSDMLGIDGVVFSAAWKALNGLLLGGGSARVSRAKGQAVVVGLWRAGRGQWEMQPEAPRVGGGSPRL